MEFKLGKSTPIYKPIRMISEAMDVCEAPQKAPIASELEYLPNQSVSSINRTSWRNKSTIHQVPRDQSDGGDQEHY